MRVVADTNTVVSAFLWVGPPKAVLDAARDGGISLHTTPALLVELKDVLSRDKFTARTRQVGSTVAGMLTEYRALVAVELPAPISPTARDPDDDQVLATALGAQARLIVTREHELLTLGTFDNILILPAAHALERITAAS